MKQPVFQIPRRASPERRDRLSLCAFIVAALPLSLCHAGVLPMLIEDMLASHPSLRSQQAQGRSAKEGLEAAKWQYFPTPSLSIETAQAGANDVSYGGDKNVAVLRLQQPLYTGGRLKAGVEKAEAGVSMGQYSLESTRWDLAVRMVQAYSDWLGAYYKNAAYERSLSALALLRQKIERRIAGGASPSVDLTLVVGRIDQTEAEFSIARAQRAAALARLSQLAGHAVQDADLANAAADALKINESLAELMARAEARNPSIARLLASVRVKEAEVTERKADLTPEVYLRLEHQRGNFAYLNRGPENRIFVGMSTRFGAGLSSLSQVGAARGQYEAALADVDSARVSLGEQLRSDFALAEAGERRLLALAQSLQSAEEISKAWDRQFVAGLKSWLDVMNAVRELSQLELQIADVKAAQLLLTWRISIFSDGIETTNARADGKTINAGEGRNVTLLARHAPAQPAGIAVAIAPVTQEPVAPVTLSVTAVAAIPAIEGQEMKISRLMAARQDELKLLALAEPVAVVADVAKLPAEAEAPLSLRMTLLMDRLDSHAAGIFAQLQQDNMKVLP